MLASSRCKVGGDDVRVCYLLSGVNLSTDLKYCFGNHWMLEMMKVMMMKEIDEPVAYDPMEADDQLLLLRSEPASPDVRPQIIYPPQPATLPTSLKP